MRQALNENPKVQAAVIAVLLVVGVLMFMKMSSGGGGDASGDAAALNEAGTAGTGPGATTTDPASAGGTGAGATTAATAATDPATAATAVAIPPAPPASAGSIPPEALVAGPGLPADVIRAYAQGNVIVLLLVKEGGTDDELVEDAVRRISKPGVSVFVAPASKVARYSRITQGVGVNRVPALVVVRPRNVSGNSPQATVSYGFRELDSVLQAVDDALYEGSDNLPYHPG